MIRTLPNRVAARMPTIPPVAYADAIAGAVAFLHAQLRNPDTAIGMTAAMALLDLEKTRMRHGQPVAGAAPHIAAGLPADDTATDGTTVSDSAAIVFDGTRPAGKPAAICDGQIPADSPPTNAMTLDEMMADPEMRDVIRQTRRELERADPSAAFTDESVGRMLHARMRELRGRGATPATPQVDPS